MQSKCAKCHMALNPSEVLTVIEEDWRKPYLDYILRQQLPACKKAAAKIKRRIWKFSVNAERHLVRHGFNEQSLLCISNNEVQEKLSQAHEGTCGEHQGGRKLYLHLLKYGYYWPTMENDSIEFAKRCKSCQLHGNMIRAPQVELQSISTPWPFHTWTFDLIGPINPPSNGNVWILAATEVFTKWVEAIPLKKASGQNVVKFIKEHIICRFGIPNRILSDNGTPFINQWMAALTEEYSINHVKSSPYYPKGNGQSEATNKTILKILGRMVHDEHKWWSEALVNALWAYRTSEREATKFTPFSLVYGCEAVIPLNLAKKIEEEGLPAMHEQGMHLEGIDERRDKAARNNSIYQARISRTYDKMVRPRYIREGDWVLKAAPFVMRSLAAPKFSPKWEGPFVVHKAAANGCFELYDPREGHITRPINAKWIKKYYA